MVSITLIALPLIFLVASSICALGMTFWVWPSVGKIQENIEKDGYFKGIFSMDLFYALLKVMALAVLTGIMVVAALFWLAKDVFTYICSSFWIQLILNIAPFILEIAGIILTIIAVGVPIVGIGMFVEVFTLICDMMDGEIVGAVLGLLGLIPIGGLPFSIIRGLGKVGLF